MSSYVFGPVPSRRLGRSLGVDLVPFKTCTYDCIYCQLGVTTCKTLERKEWVPLDELVSQIREKLSTNPDYITLSGSGEPTLYSRLGELIAAIKEMTDTPVAVITNGSLLWDKDVRDGLAQADLIVPSLDAGDDALFQRVNRPHPSISFEQMAEGLIAFCKNFKGECRLEVFLLGGMTGKLEEVEKIKKFVDQMNPDRIQLNTVARPTAENFALPVPKEDMEKFAKLLGEQAEVIADFSGVHRKSEFAAKREDVLDMLRRRPCTVDDIAAGLGVHTHEALKYVTELVEQKAIVGESRNDRTYYKVL